jgi:predicted DNA-binding protein
MTKDLMFKLRLDDLDRKRLDAVAQHYSAPAATVVRMLIKEKYDGIQAAGPRRRSTTGSKLLGRG